MGDFLFDYLANICYISSATSHPGTLMLLLSIVSLALSATPADVAEVKAYVSGIKSCQGISPLSLIGDDMYIYELHNADALVNGVPTNELRISFSVPICSFGGGMKKPLSGWPDEGTVEDLAWNGVVEAGTIKAPAYTISTIDFEDAGSGRVIGEKNRSMWQAIYDRAIATVIAQCRGNP